MNNLYPLWAKEKHTQTTSELRAVEETYSRLKNKESKYAIGFKQLATALMKVVEIWEKEMAKCLG